MLTSEKDRVIQNLERMKEEATKKFNEMIKEAQIRRKKQSRIPTEEVEAIKENMSLLNNIKESIEEKENTYEDAVEKQMDVNAVADNTEHHLPRVETFKYSVYLPGFANYHVGQLVQREIPVLPATFPLNFFAQNQNQRLEKKEIFGQTVTFQPHGFAVNQNQIGLVKKEHSGQTFQPLGFARNQLGPEKKEIVRQAINSQTQLFAMNHNQLGPEKKEHSGQTFQPLGFAINQKEVGLERVAPKLQRESE